MRLLAAVTILIAGACVHQTVRNMPSHQDVRFTGDPAIHQLIQAANVWMLFRDSQPPVFNADLLSQYHSDLRCEYRGTWYDAQGLSVDDPSRAWIPVLVPARSKVTLKAVAPRDEVSRCELEIRLTQPID